MYYVGKSKFKLPKGTLPLQGKIITLSSFLLAPKKGYNLRVPWAHSGHSRKNIFD
jgi:hypothetical protein